MELRRTVQCKKCPWKVSTNPFDIPDGYDVEKHRALSCAIAQPGDFRVSRNKAMACHHSKEGKEEHCVGWIHNQLGVGNNIGLRIQMMSCTNIKDLRVIGEQHERFEDTLPY
jgi:hypothetical protein